MAIVDHYGQYNYRLQVQPKKEEDDRPIDYVGKRSRLEFVKLNTPETGNRRITAVTFLAFRASDGELFWQADQVKTTQLLFTNNFRKCAPQCFQDLFKGLRKAAKSE